jgi:uncharacterized protein GlcG (DUF336 family)
MTARTILAATLLLAASGSAHADATVLRMQSLGFDAALKAATTALKECQKRGAMVAVAVTDRAGLPLVVLRDPLAGMHTPDTATRKAWTAISFRAPTTTLERATAASAESSGIRHLPGVAMIGGGILVEAAGSLIGAIGISGAPNGALDETCAKAGLAAIRDDIELGN